MLRAVYADYYRRILTWCQPGSTVEIGAGSGNLKEHVPNVIATDVVSSPWLDAALDAQSMPFPSDSIANIVGIDVLHHIEYPRHFLAEAQRTLQPDGRIVLVEPAITPVSWVACKLAHPEPIDLDADPLVDGRPAPNRHPLDANQALPTLLAGRHRARLEREFPELRVVWRQRLSVLVYPLSGGFRPWSLIPSRIVGPILRLERGLAPLLGRLMAFRLFLVIEKHAASKPTSRQRNPACI